jgi:mono/diheme cytochrome c family protein
MLHKKLTKIAALSAIPALVLFAGVALAQEEPSACVVQGALAFDNWVKEDAGGTGTLPVGEVNGDYLRCKACHGWDRRGVDGGYIRRSRTETRPNAGAGDGDSTSRAIATGSVTSDMIMHAGKGRSYAEGTGSWVPLDAEGSAANKAAHSSGYTLGNQHPDFTEGGITQDQVDCLVEFLNFADGDPNVYFSNIDNSQKPVAYTVIETADAAAGETYFNDTCTGCHTLEWASDYVRGDGKYSELVHKVRWGVPDEIMTRAAMGDPTAIDVANLAAYLQGATGTGFAVNPGLTGTWWDAARAGEGFVLEFGFSNDVLALFASFYTYDNMGNQVWLTAQSTSIDRDTVTVDVFITNGAMWGDDFDPADVNTVAWGSGTFIFPGCDAGSVVLVPNVAMVSNGFSELDIGLTRDLLVSGNPCPTVTSN